MSTTRIINIRTKTQMLEEISECHDTDCNRCRYNRIIIEAIDAEAERDRTPYACWDDIPMDVRERVLDEYDWDLNRSKGTPHARPLQTVCPWGAAMWVMDLKRDDLNTPMSWPVYSDVKAVMPDIDAECVHRFMNAFDAGKISDLAVAIGVRHVD